MPSRRSWGDQCSIPRTGCCSNGWALCTHAWPPRAVTASRFPFIRPSIPEPAAWLPLLAEAYETRQFSNFGSVVTAFEGEIGARFEGRACVAVANATLGLTAALLALRGARGAVVLPAFTFPATAHAVSLAGCSPVFCEVSAEAWELEPSALSELVA